MSIFDTIKRQVDQNPLFVALNKVGGIADTLVGAFTDFQKQRFQSYKDLAKLPQTLKQGGATPESLNNLFVDIGTSAAPFSGAIGAAKSVVPKVAKELVPEAPKVFKGFKDLTTKFLDYAKGKTSLSKQEILDFARRPELKKGEADLLLKKLEELSQEKNVFYHGTSAESAKNIKSRGFSKDKIFYAEGDTAAGIHFGDGLYITRSKKYASEFGDDVVELNIDNLNVLDSNSKKFRVLEKKALNKLDDWQRELYEDRGEGSYLYQEIMNLAEKEGYDAIDYTGYLPSEDISDIVVFPNSIKKITVRPDKIPAQDFADSIRRETFGKVGLGSLLTGGAASGLGLGTALGATAGAGLLERLKKGKPKEELFVENTKKDEPLTKGIITHYNPADANQTKVNPDGKGALNRRVEFGDVAVGDRDLLAEVKKRYAEGKDTFVEIPGLKAWDTPWGKGVFRVNDTMNIRFDGQHKIDVAIPEREDAEKLRNIIGKSNLDYKVIRN